MFVLLILWVLTIWMLKVIIATGGLIIAAIGVVTRNEKWRQAGIATMQHAGRVRAILPNRRP